MVELARLVGLSGGILLYLLAQTGSDLGYESLALEITTGRWLSGLTSAMYSAQPIGTPVTGLFRHWLLMVPATQQNLLTRPFD